MINGVKVSIIVSFSDFNYSNNHTLEIITQVEIIKEIVENMIEIPNKMFCKLSSDIVVIFRN